MFSIWCVLSSFERHCKIIVWERDFWEGLGRQTVLGGLGVGEPRYGVHGVLVWDI